MFELHTSDFDPCPARALLKREGKFEGVAGKALFRGLLAHSALESVHAQHVLGAEWSLHDCMEKTIADLRAEGRELSDSVMANTLTILKEVQNMVESYQRRVIPFCDRSGYTFLGTEVPVYWQLSPEVFLSSHIDILFIDKNNRPIIWDWKWRASPSAVSDLSRSLQLACYWGTLASGEGIVRLEKSTALMLDKRADWAIQGEGWTYPPDGSQVPQVSWVDLPSLKPYSRATLGKDDSGNAVEFKRGDDRPLDRIIKTIDHKVEQVENIRSAALLRAQMIMDGNCPFIPQGCSHCESEPWCPRFDTAEISVTISSEQNGYKKGDNNE